MALFETGGGGTWAWFGELDGSGWWSRYTLIVSASYAGCAAMGQGGANKANRGGKHDGGWGWVVARARWGSWVGAMGKCEIGGLNTRVLGTRTERA